MKRKSWDIFCKVVDNYGDIGVAYRLAKELHHLGANIRLFVDDLNAFKKIENIVDNTQQIQTIKEIQIYKWTKDFSYDISPSTVIIEMFACNIPETYINKINENNLWINLEYLCAEKWIEDCHCQPSFDHGKRKYFFFPGFTSKSGGLNFEEKCIKNNNEKSLIFEKILSQLSSTQYLNISKLIKISVFTYESLYLVNLIKNYQLKKDLPLIFLIPDGRFSTFLKEKCTLLKIEGTTCWYKSPANNFIAFIPMTNQEEYDQILKNCDINFVRGEDSFVRAQLASKPFIWHIYPQEEEYHLVKLKAFLDLYLKNINKEDFVVINQLMFNFNTNNESNLITDFSQFLKRYKTINTHAKKWFNYLISNGSLASNLLMFAQKD